MHEITAFCLGRFFDAGFTNDHASDLILEVGLKASECTTREPAWSLGVTLGARSRLNKGKRAGGMCPISANIIKELPLCVVQRFDIFSRTVTTRMVVDVVLIGSFSRLFFSRNKLVLTLWLNTDPFRFSMSSGSGSWLGWCCCQKDGNVITLLINITPFAFTGIENSTVRIC